ncbi:MAG: hypothetical protein ACRBCL_04335 [Maritimibacter sp.]
MRAGGGAAAVDYGTDFVLVAATASADETFTLPCSNIGGFSATIDWGDGSTSTITAYDDSDLTHSYAAPGDHTIRVSGTMANVYFNNGGDKLKVKRVIQLGHVGMIRLDNAFYGCANLTEFSSGACDTSAVGAAKNMLRGTGVSVPDVSTMDTSNVFRMPDAFRSAAISDIIGIENFDLSSLAYGYGLSGYILGGTLPTARYDQVLINWAAQDLASRPAQSPHFGGSKYTPGGAAEAGRTHMISEWGWTITDGGAA